MYKFNLNHVIRIFIFKRILVLFVCVMSLGLFSQPSFSLTNQAEPTVVISNQVLDSTMQKRQQCSDPQIQVRGDSGTLLAYGCCRICRVGKACGNSCINHQLNCHQPAGCACDE